MVFIAVSVVILLALFILSFSKKVPSIPVKALHRDVTTNDSCGVCHGPGKQSPLKDTHPPKEQCLICHKMK